MNLVTVTYFLLIYKKEVTHATGACWALNFIILCYCFCYFRCQVLSNEDEKIEE